MYQESDDKLKGTAKKDTLIFILLIVFFLVAGGIATILKTTFNSNAPLYAFAVLFAIALYFIYRMRIVGWRYTVFYKEPEAEYDARFDEYITHEDYPYPVGTVVIEKTVSAKGEILAVIKKEELVDLLEPGADFSADDEMVYGPRKKEASSSLIFARDGKITRIYFTPSEQFKEYVRGLMDQ
ncbi:MAG: hypothetical protein IJM18_10960 [Clostridia bacterium]|nr:hypothetical protein [Clostridia bacterium]